MADDLIYRIDEAAERLKLNPAWLHRKAGKRQIPVRIVGGEYGWTEEDLKQILDLCKKPVLTQAAAPRQQKRRKTGGEAAAAPASNVRRLRPRAPWSSGAA